MVDAGPEDPDSSVQVVTTTFLGSTCAPAKGLGMVESASLLSRSGFVFSLPRFLVPSADGGLVLKRAETVFLDWISSSPLSLSEESESGQFCLHVDLTEILGFSLSSHLLRTSAHISRLRQRFFGILEISRSELESATAAHHDESSVSWCTLM